MIRRGCKDCIQFEHCIMSVVQSISRGSNLASAADEETAESV
jgi:hypothetical protein